jgi:hypothetical protein
VENGAGGQRMMLLTTGANIESPGTFPVIGMLAIFTLKAIRPFASEKIVMARLFIRKTGIKLKLVFGKILLDNEFLHGNGLLSLFETIIAREVCGFGHIWSKPLKPYKISTSQPVLNLTD